MRPPRGCEPRVVDAIVEPLDVPATIRDIATAPRLAASEGRTMLGHVRGAERTNPRPISISENWGFASFETERYKLVVDEDAGTPCQLFDRTDGALEDDDRLSDPECKPVIDELMDSYVRPFLTVAPKRPHKRPFTS